MPKKKTPIKAVIFDLDGTLYAMTPRFKVLFTLNCLPTFWRLPQYMKLRNTFRGTDCGTGQELFTEMAEAFENEEKFSGAEKWMKKKFYDAFFRTLTKMKNRSTIRPLLKTLRKADFKLAVVSDFGKVKPRLLALGLDPSLFDACISCEEEGALKPAVRPVKKLCKEWGIQPTEALMVGDRDDTDGEIAKKLHMRFFKVPGNTNKQWKEQLSKLRSYIFKNR